MKKKSHNLYLIRALLPTISTLCYELGVGLGLGDITVFSHDTVFYPYCEHDKTHGNNRDICYACALCVSTLNLMTLPTCMRKHHFCSHGRETNLELPD